MYSHTDRTRSGLARKQTRKLAAKVHSTPYRWRGWIALVVSLAAACSDEQPAPSELGSSAQTSRDCTTSGASHNDNGEFWLGGTPVEFGWELEGNLWGILHLYRPNRMSPAGAVAYAASAATGHEDVNASELTDEIWSSWSMPTRIEYVRRYLIRDPSQPNDPASPLNVAWDHFVRVQQMRIAGYENVSRVLTLDSVANWETHAAQPVRSLREWGRQTNALEVLIQQSERRFPTVSPDGDQLGMFFHAWASFDRSYALDNAPRTLVLAALLATLNAQHTRSAIAEYTFPHTSDLQAYVRSMDSPLFATWHGVYPGDYVTLVTDTLAGTTQFKRAYVALRNLVSDATGDPQRFMGSNRVAFEFRGGVTSATQIQLVSSALRALSSLTAKLERARNNAQALRATQAELTKWTGSAVLRIRDVLSEVQWRALVAIGAVAQSLDADRNLDAGLDSAYQAEDLVARLALPLLPWETTFEDADSVAVVSARDEYVLQLQHILDQFAELPSPTVGQGAEHAMQAAQAIHQWATTLAQIESSQ
jgi:hypothetical protein